MSKSSTEVKYKVATYKIIENLRMYYLRAKLGIIISKLIKVLCDDIYAIHMVANLILHGFNKHIVVDYHFIWECIIHNT